MPFHQYRHDAIARFLIDGGLVDETATEENDDDEG